MRLQQTAYLSELLAAAALEVAENFSGVAFGISVGLWPYDKIISNTRAFSPGFFPGHNPILPAPSLALGQSFALRAPRKLVNPQTLQTPHQSTTFSWRISFHQSTKLDIGLKEVVALPEAFVTLVLVNYLNGII